MDQVVGAWTRTTIFEEFNGVKKDTSGPGVIGALILDRSGRYSYHITADGRPKAGGDPSRGPVGRTIGYFGIYTIRDADKSVTFAIERATFPGWDGTEQKRIITISADAMRFRAATPLPSPDGPFIPIIDWVRVK